MKKCVLIILCMFIWINGYCQFNQIELRIYAGYNLSEVKEETRFSLFPDGSLKSYSGQPGKLFGLNGSKKLWKPLSVELGLLFEETNYEVRQETSLLFRTELEERLRLISIPVTLRFKPTDNLLDPFINCGLVYSIPISSMISGTRFGGTSYHTKQDITNQRKNMFSMLYEIGIDIKSFFISFNYIRPLSIANDPKERYSNLEMRNDLQYVESDFKIDRYSVNIGYTIKL